MIPLFLLPGWGQHGGAFASLCTSLAPRPTQCAELPGHAGTPWHEGDFALDTLIDHYAALAPAQCHVSGWSLGGLVALRWAQRYPQQIKKLVLFATTPCFGQREHWPHGAPSEVQSAFAEQVAADPQRGLQRFADLLAEGEADVRATRRALRHLLSAAPLPATPALLAGLQCLADTDLRESLQAQPPTQATLLLHGEDDTITACAASQWLAQTLPQARLQCLPHCGHAPMLSHSAEVARAIQTFLDD